jgi:hypothetical protein
MRIICDSIVISEGRSIIYCVRVRVCVFLKIVLLVSFTTFPHGTELQIIYISNDNDCNRNETSNHSYKSTNGNFSSCKTKHCVM